MEDRVRAITKIIMMNKDPNAFLEEDFSLQIAKAAIIIAEKKKDEIFLPET